MYDTVQTKNTKHLSHNVILNYNNTTDILDIRGRRYVPDKNFSYNSAMTFTFDLKHGTRSLHTL